ncbi:MAG: beta-ketoacyl synthase chain length factor [Bacteroidota bacterium]
MAFINGIGLISPQKTSESRDFPSEVMEYTADYLRCIEPVYRNYIDPIQSRRMSRLIKMGITSAKISLADAGCLMPDAIITGTGLGSVEDTEKILGEITKEERFLNPTPFIQSTYNTISSQIAIQLKCHNYNSTYVHRTFSFESGLTDALMQMEEGMATHVLVGAIDEMTMNHLQITRRIGQWKKEAVNNLKLLESRSPGALAGEGSAFFLLGREQSPSSYARIIDVGTWFNLNGSFKPENILPSFLGQHDLALEDIDLVLLGFNGDCDHDPVYRQFASRFFPGKPQAWYKHLCGEYHTATGFGLYVAAHILRYQRYPDILHLNSTAPSRLKNLLIYNHFRNVNHSMMLVQGTT